MKFRIISEITMEINDNIGMEEEISETIEKGDIGFSKPVIIILDEEGNKIELGEISEEDIMTKLKDEVMKRARV